MGSMKSFMGNINLAKGYLQPLHHLLPIPSGRAVGAGALQESRGGGASWGNDGGDKGSSNGKSYV